LGELKELKKLKELKTIVFSLVILIEERGAEQQN